MKKAYIPYCQARRGRFVRMLREERVAAAVFEDTEGRRDPAIRYFTGHPGDAVLVISAEGESILFPWDENMAVATANADMFIPLTRFSRKPVSAVFSAMRRLRIPDGGRIDIPPSMPYPQFLRYVDALPGYNVLCRETGSHSRAVSMRAEKDDYEIERIREAARVTDLLIGRLEEGIRSGSIQTETDAALLIERECRAEGCEDTGFGTLVANPERSFGIHCFPPYTAGRFPAEGLSIIDFGVKMDGYTSDVTVTFAMGKLSAEQETQLDLIQEAYESALELYKPGVAVRAAAAKADAVFARAKRAMPHSLGHGIGLEAHEFPTIKPSAPRGDTFLPGMVVTLEPGLYSRSAGGCRLENDVLITEDGNEVLTSSRIIRL